MNPSARIPSDLFDGPDRIYADRLLSHCLVRQLDPPASEFAAAVTLLRGIDRTVKFATVIPVENRVRRYALMCDVVLELARLAQRPPSTPRDGRAR